MGRNGNLQKKKSTSTKATENPICWMNPLMINTPSCSMAEKRLECSGTLCLRPNPKKFENVGQNPTSSGHLKDHIWQLVIVVVLPFGADQDSKRWQDSIIPEFNSLTFHLVKSI